MNRTEIIKVRVTAEEKQAYIGAAKALGKPISDIVRDSLARLLKRVQK